MTELGKEGSGVLTLISKVLQRLATLQSSLCRGGTPPGLLCPQHVQMHVKHRSPYSCAPGHPRVLVWALHMQEEKSCLTANVKLLGLTWPSKQPVPLWASPGVCGEHP